jgi:hypothetical protein
LSENKKLELLDQYDDVTFALLMDEYAEEEGARLRKEFEEAQAAGEVSDTPDSLDEKCLQMIHRDFAKKRGKENVRKIIRMTSKVAVAVMVFFGVAATTIMSVDAFRYPVLNYILELHNRYTSVQFSDDPMHSESHSVAIQSCIPDDYEEIAYNDLGSGLFHCIYQNSEGNIVRYSTNPADGEYRYDTENTDTEKCIIYVYDGYIVRKDGIQIVWFDADTNLVHSLFATDIPEETLLHIAFRIAEEGVS